MKKATKQLNPTTVYQALRRINTCAMNRDGAMEIETAITNTTEAVRILSYIEHYRCGRVTFSEMMNFIITEEFSNE